MKVLQMTNSILASQIRSERGKGAIGFHQDRISGLRDLLWNAKDMRVLDIGTNRGLVAFEFARHGAALVHGCDIYEAGLNAAREIFTEVEIPSQFEVVDLTEGPVALERAFGKQYLARYDIVLFLGIYHKLKEQVSEHVVFELVRHLVDRTERFFVVRTTMIDALAPCLGSAGLWKVHFSALSPFVGPLEIWSRT
jgi:ribosomal protein L11 methylase PrmA